MFQSAGDEHSQHWHHQPAGITVLGSLSLWVFMETGLIWCATSGQANDERRNWVFPSTIVGGTESFRLKVRQLARNKFSVRHRTSQWWHLQNKKQAGYSNPKLADNGKIKGEKSGWEMLSAQRVLWWFLVTTMINSRPSFPLVSIGSSWMCNIWTELKQCAKVGPVSYQARPSQSCYWYSAI